MIENDKFYEILEGMGVDVENFDERGDEEIELHELRGEVFAEMERRVMVIALGRTEDEELQNRQAYFTTQTDHWDRILRLEAASKGYTEDIPTVEAIEGEAWRRAAADLEEAIKIQEALVSLMVELLYFIRNGGIENLEEVKTDYLIKTLAQLDIDLDNIDPRNEAFIDLYLQMVTDQATTEEL